MRKCIRGSDNGEKFVSIVIPTFNGQKQLLLLLESLENQSVKNFEVIVVDDGSNDGTREAIAKVIKRYPVSLRYYYLDNTDIFGAGIARNCGAKHAEGNILLFLDQDCVAERELVRKHIDHHETRDVILGYYAGYGNEKEQYDFSKLKGYVQGNSPVSIIKEFRDQLFKDVDNEEAWKCFVSSHFSIKKKIFNDVCFDESFTQWGCEDIDLGYRLFLGKKAIHFVRECVAYNSSKAPKRTKKKFLSLAESLIYMYKKYQTEEMKLYCFERFYHTPIKYRDSLQFIFRNNEFKIKKFRTGIFIEENYDAQIVLGRDLLDVKNTVEHLIPLIGNVHFDVSIVKTLKDPCLLEFRDHFHQLIKILRDNKKKINLEDIRKQSFLLGTRLIGPKILSIDFHNKCNATCLFCFLHSPLLEHKACRPVPLDLKVILRMLNQAYEMGVKKIRIASDGEPLLSPDALPLLQSIAKMRFELELLTNGTMLKDEHIIFLSQIPKLGVFINFSAAKKTTYQNIYGGHPDNYNFALRSLSLLSKLKQMKMKRNEIVSICTVYVITKINYHEISEYILLVKKMGVDDVYFKLAILYEGTEDLSVSNIEIRKFKKELLKAMSIANKCDLSTNLNLIYNSVCRREFPLSTANKEHNLNLPSTQCYNGWFYARVNSLGKFYICCRDTVDFGNVQQKDFKEIFFSSQVKEILDEGAKGISPERKMWSKCNYCYDVATNKMAKEWLDQQ